jgi:hypothetical protein
VRRSDDTVSREFVQWLASLAPEGETALIVRQKPREPIEYHADGAIKATWPAFHPRHGNIAGEAWYGNTASFMRERFADGRPSASAAHCEYVLVMVLDDIGTKSKTPPLPPTWVMETSAGNFQWGYAFSEQPTKAEFAAAIRAVADAGYTDPGAVNPVRNFRIPGSVNFKPGREAFTSRLVEWERAREYTLDEICDALGVVPGAPESAGPRSIRLADDGGDDVAAWLSEQGLVLSRPNAEGWMGVMCPQADQHTDGNPEGRYMPASRAYCCLHSHCIDLNSVTFLRWVADQGGPSHAPGLREELPQTFDENELVALFQGVGEGVRFKTVTDRETGVCRGFGFANVDDEKLAEALIGQLHGREFGGNTLRVEVSERRDARGGAAPNDRRPAAGAPVAQRRAADKIVHADNVDSQAPDPRWAGELAKLKDLLANQTVGV